MVRIMEATRALAILMIASILLSVLTSSTLILSARATVVSVGPNISIVETPQDRQQVEPTIAVDPRNSNIIVAGAQDYRLKASGGHRWHGYYRSTDGGSTWTQSLVPGFPGDNSPPGLASPLHKFNATSDPVLAFDRNGNVYYTGIAFNITSTNAVTGNTAFVTKYVNDGASYSGTTMITGVADADKQWVVVDNTGGPFNGNVYVAFDATIGSTFATVFTKSTDGGATFSTPVFVPADKSGELPGVTVAPNGDVFVSTDGFDPMTGVPLHRIQVSKLTNGGSTLVQTVIVASPVNELPSPLPGNSFRTFTIPQIAADVRGLYLVWDEFGTDADVFLSRSTDGGSTWTSALRINDVTTGHQFFPTVATSAGIVSVAWYDSRLNSGATITALDVYYSQSTDGGQTFLANTRVTSSSFNPNIVKRTDAPNNNDPFMGDYIQIAAGPAAVQPIWADNRNACDTVDSIYGCVDQDAFTATITVSSPPFHDVAVPNMRVSRNFAYAGIVARPVQVNVTVSNLGSATETVTVKAFANSTVIGTQDVTVAVGAISVISFSWNVQFFTRGNYHLSSQALQVTGETNLSNNQFAIGGLFEVRKAGDVNGDGAVDIDDLVAVFLNQFTRNIPSYYDIDNDGDVDLDDLVLTYLHQFT